MGNYCAVERCSGIEDRNKCQNFSPLFGRYTNSNPHRKIIEKGSIVYVKNHKKNIKKQIRKTERKLLYLKGQIEDK